MGESGGSPSRSKSLRGTGSLAEEGFLTFIVTVYRVLSQHYLQDRHFLGVTAKTPEIQ